MADLTLAPEAPDLVEIAEPDISHLVTEDDTPVDNIFSEKQQRLLTESLYTSWEGPPGGDRPFVAMANVGLFYDVDMQAVVPDALVSVDVELPEELWERRHRSYFVWEYGKPPDVVIEVVSNRKGEELTKKRNLYARLGIAYYIVFDPAHQLSNKTLHLFERRGLAYVEIRRAWLPLLELGLTLWEGEFEAKQDVWLRWTDSEGNLLLTGAEKSEQERQRAEQEHQRAEREHQRAEQERQRAEKLAAQLRALGVEPEA